MLVSVSLAFFAIGLLMIGGFGNALLTGRSPFLVHKVQFAVFVAGGALFAAMGGGALICGVWHLVSRRPCLVISDHGIVDNVSCLPVGLVGWSEIEDIRIVKTVIRFSTHETLVIQLKDPVAAFLRQSSSKRRLMRLCFRGGKANVNIPRSLLPISLDEFIKLIESRRPSAPTIPAAEVTGRVG
jgi:hypothetical protein